jgi:hypothetical protein
MIKSVKIVKIYIAIVANFIHFASSLLTSMHLFFLRKTGGLTTFATCQRSGFALVLALSLMAFVLVLLLSITAMVHVESSLSKGALTQLEVRQNALLSMQLALGRLQKEMGPDQRVSASGVRLDSDPYDVDDFDPITGSLATDGVPSERQFWTGVWETKVDADGFRNSQFRSWLASGGQVDRELNLLDDLSTVSFTQSVELVSGVNPVTVGKNEIAGLGASTGRYAYWVGDEGAKAKVAIPEVAVSVVDEALYPQHFGLSAINGLSWLTDTASAGIDRASSRGLFKVSANNLAGTSGAGAVDRLFHDLSYVSYGVLADTSRGGLKQDLTAGLYDLGDKPTGLIFPPASGGAPNPLDPGGASWEQLRSWVEVQPVGGTLPVVAADTNQAGIHPVLTGFQVYFIPSYDTATGEVRINYFPAVTIWNPYNQPLAGETYTVSIGMVRINGGGMDDFNSFMSGWDLFVDDNSGSGQQEIDISSSDPLEFQFTTEVIEPGEALVFGELSSHTASNFGSSATPVVEAGYTPGMALYRTLPGVQVSPPPGEVVKFGWRQQNFRTHALKLSRAGVTGEEVIQEAVYIADTPLVRDFSGGSWGSPALPMASNPSASQPFSDPAKSYAYGVKLMRVFADNEQTWNPMYVRPESRNWLRNFNPRARTSGPMPMIYEDINITSNANTSNPSFVGSLHKGAGAGGSAMDRGFQPYDFGKNVTAGSGQYSADYSEKAVLFQSAPDRFRLHSIGQLMHAPLYNIGDVSNLEERVKSSRFGNLIPAYAVGSSAADPAIALDQLSRDFGNSSYPRYFKFAGVHYDYSYSLNEVLWDRFFFSTLSDVSNGVGVTDGNSRIVPISGNSLAPVADYNQSAVELLVDGAFNVNSTSIHAWSALLGSFLGSQVELADGTIVDADDQANPSSPILRVDNPLSGAAPDSPEGDDFETYAGYRDLNLTQINELSASIVGEVKLRGPFVSVSDFVNRMPRRDGILSESTNAFRLSGTLASAIAKAGMNEGLSDLATIETGAPNVETEAEVGWRLDRLPGWLTQADILARLGSVLSARSDTFSIRGYGEVESALTGEVISARCEAIVQRLPDFLDDVTNAPETPVDSSLAAAAGLSPLSVTNQTFGRRFVVVDFRWIVEDEM